MRTVLACVDFSEASLQAARWSALHLAPDAHVVLAHVVAVPDMPSFLRADLLPPAAVAAEIAPRVRGALTGLARAIGKRRASVRVLVGRPEVELPVLAAEVGADLIAVGRGTRRRGNARFGGTLATRLLANAGRPVLVVQGAHSTAPRRIVAGVDHRSSGGYVLESACDIAGHARVDALHVVDPLLSQYVRASAASAHATLPSGVDRWLGLRTLTWLASLAEVVNEEDSRVAPVVAQGDAGREIIRHAKLVGADLVVVGAGGDDNARRRGASPRVVGSTARQVAWGAQCPVLVLPTMPVASALPAKLDSLRASEETIPAPLLRRLRGVPPNPGWDVGSGGGAA